MHASTQANKERVVIQELQISPMGIISVIYPKNPDTDKRLNIDIFNQVYRAWVCSGVLRCRGAIHSRWVCAASVHCRGVIWGPRGKVIHAGPWPLGLASFPKAKTRH